LEKTRGPVDGERREGGLREPFDSEVRVVSGREVRREREWVARVDFAIFSAFVGGQYRVIIIIIIREDILKAMSWEPMVTVKTTRFKTWTIWRYVKRPFEIRTAPT